MLNSISKYNNPFPDKHCLWPGKSTAIPSFKTRNDLLVLLWQLKAAQVVLLHCFSSKYISTHSRVENAWVRLDWICTQSFPQNPCTCSLTTAFWDGVQSTQGIPASWWAQKRPQLKERNLETLDEVFWQPQGSLLREVHMTKPALCYRSVTTHNSLVKVLQNHTAKSTKNVV